MMKRKRLLAICALLLATLFACAPKTDIWNGYEESPEKWIAERFEKKAWKVRNAQQLSDEETQQLNELARMVSVLPVFYHTNEIPERDMLAVLGLYKGYLAWYDKATDGYILKPLSGTRYPADSIESDGPYSPVVLLSGEKANAFLQSLLGMGLPNGMADIPYTEERSVWWVYMEGGIVHMPSSDYDPCNYLLEGCRWLGGDVFYLIFSEDWRGFPGKVENWKVLPDRMRMLVERADNEWGFAIKAILKDHDGNTLPPEPPQ